MKFCGTPSSQASLPLANQVGKDFGRWRSAWKLKFKMKIFYSWLDKKFDLFILWRKFKICSPSPREYLCGERYILNIQIGARTYESVWKFQSQYWCLRNMLLFLFNLHNMWKMYNLTTWAAGGKVWWEGAFRLEIWNIKVKTSPRSFLGKGKDGFLIKYFWCDPSPFILLPQKIYMGGGKIFYLKLSCILGLNTL